VFGSVQPDMFVTALSSITSTYFARSSSSDEISGISPPFFVGRQQQDDKTPKSIHTCKFFHAQADFGI
jgi:hypothetical protein